ncbi:hypothetical protein pdam_00016134 [Pocillopora damicornis]|uniref:Uncharacterized protein n=1 Tax=Pocillopora damicornis TaxID=46731 RepID=A0A3M6UB35_POCDA|nr:hypothetical protein pdam_00016134 [Pocillopora damicornis]
MVDSSSSKCGSISGFEYSDFEASMEGASNDRAYEPVGLSDLIRQDEPKIGCESQKRTKNPCIAPPQSRKRRTVSVRKLPINVEEGRKHLLSISRCNEK